MSVANSKLVTTYCKHKSTGQAKVVLTGATVLAYYTAVESGNLAELPQLAKPSSMPAVPRLPWSLHRPG